MSPLLLALPGGVRLGSHGNRVAQRFFRVGSPAMMLLDDGDGGDDVKSRGCSRLGPRRRSRRVPLPSGLKFCGWSACSAVRNAASSEAHAASDSKLASRRLEEGRDRRLDLSFPTYVIWGANTGVGKTLVSAGLTLSAIVSDNKKSSVRLSGEMGGKEEGGLSPSPNSKVIYIKPVQTGFPQDSDAGFVSSKVSEMASSKNIQPKADYSPSHSHSHGRIPSGVATWKSIIPFANESCLESCMSWGWKEPVSPHLAAAREGGTPSDEEIVEVVRSRLSENLGNKGMDTVFAIVETAGGVASPAPSGSLQCDVYRPLRLPCVLVGDGRLGGISSTIAAHESLNLRGYDTKAVILIDHGLDNHTALKTYFPPDVPVMVLPPLPPQDEPLTLQWFKQSEPIFDELYQRLVLFHERTLKSFEEIRKDALDTFWWPFTQHGLVSHDQITIIDSRLGSDFAVLKTENIPSHSFESSESKLENHEKNVTYFMDYQFDGCASWWTQGPDSKFQQKLAQVVAYACGRYGHVMFPQNVYTPAVECSKLLIDGPGKGWASRCFFSDNGSTAVEVALKMAFRFFLDRNGLLPRSKNSDTRYSSNEIPLFESDDFQIIALSGSYHGDTLGAMEAQSPSSYTGILQQPWYKGRGLFLPSPSVHFKNGLWRVRIPMSIIDSSVNSADHLKDIHELTFESRDNVFDLSRDDSEICDIYKDFISNQLSRSTQVNAALLIEPVIHGAGGMVLIDPLFQRSLVKTCQSLKIPVIFDEIFTGCWRLGVESASQLLGCQPDIACYAKLLTCGILPMAATLASNDVFQAFHSKSKLEALLHGHSYTAYAVGCSVAKASLEYLKNPNCNPNLDPTKNKLHELWDEEWVQKISKLPNVERIIHIGTLFTIELTTEDAGYASPAALDLVKNLKDANVFTRPLGNVVYIMCGPLTSKPQCTQLLSKLYHSLLLL